MIFATTCRAVPLRGCFGFKDRVETASYVNSPALKAFYRAFPGCDGAQDLVSMEASMWEKVSVRIGLEEVASQKQYIAASCILLGI